eukprot:6597085-Prymnesium_polylepis.1
MQRPARNATTPTGKRECNGSAGEATLQPAKGCTGPPLERQVRGAAGARGRRWSPGRSLRASCTRSSPPWSGCPWLASPSSRPQPGTRPRTNPSGPRWWGQRSPMPCRSVSWRGRRSLWGTWRHGCGVKSRGHMAATAARSRGHVAPTGARTRGRRPSGWKGQTNGRVAPQGLGARVRAGFVGREVGLA